MKTLKELGISQTPWRVCIPDNDFVHSADDDAVCQVNWIDKDARLIASAPELYDALFRIVSAADDFVGDFPKWRVNLNSALHDARKALAKASGEDEP